MVETNPPPVRRQISDFDIVNDPQPTNSLFNPTSYRNSKQYDQLLSLLTDLLTANLSLKPLKKTLKDP